MRTGIVVEVTAADRARLEAVVADRNSPQKHVWRARIVLLTADGCGTAEIMRLTGKAKTAVWRWQERFMQAGVNGLLRDKTRPSRIPPLAPEVIERVVALTLADPPGETTHWTAAAMAIASGINAGSVRRIWRSQGFCRTASDASSCPRTRGSPPSCATSSASTSIPRRTPSCSRWTKSAISRRSTAPSRGCPSSRAAAAR
jgi:transposase